MSGGGWFSLPCAVVWWLGEAACPACMRLTWSPSTNSALHLSASHVLSGPLLGAGGRCDRRLVRVVTPCAACAVCCLAASSPKNCPCRLASLSMSVIPAVSDAAALRGGAAHAGATCRNSPLLPSAAAAALPPAYRCSSSASRAFKLCSGMRSGCCACVCMRLSALCSAALATHLQLVGRRTHGMRVMLLFGHRPVCLWAFV